MAIRIAVGEESFDEIRKNGLYYVDKTELLYELAGQTNNKVTLLTRPRRFGKTLNMSMVESFFDINRDSRVLFDGLNIVKHREFCCEWMNQYPVLFLSFKDVDGLDFEKAYAKLCAVVADLCKKLEKLPSCEGVNGADAEIFERLMYQRVSSADVQNALNEYLKFAVITGCLRIAKESIFTGTYNFASYSVLDDRFGRYFGFTRAEVDALLAAAGLSNKAAIFREWYGRLRDG